MEDYQEQFYAEILSALNEADLDVDTCNTVSRIVSVVMNNYDIVAKHTELIVYEELPECAKNYLVTRKIEGLSLQTLKLYKLKLTHFFKSVSKPINQITTNDIRLYLYYKQEESQCSDRTLDGVRSIISTFFKWANAEHYIDTNPCIMVRPIKYTRKERGYLTEMELEKLRNACEAPRDKALLEFLYSTGCRVGEIVNLKIKDINFATKEVSLFGKGAKYRTAYLNARAELALQAYLQTRVIESNEDSVFVSLRKPYQGLGKRTIERTIKDLGIKAGIDRPVFPHLIRHTTATLALQRGMDIVEIQKLLGHTNVDTTLIYAQVADENVKLSHKRYIV